MPIPFPTTSLLRSEEILVYARFRPTHIDPLTLGSRIAVARVEASLLSKDPSKGEWIESTLTNALATPETNSHLYEINPEARWYYPWGGAATVAMRLIEHVFEAHVFRRAGSDLVPVAVARSTKFHLKSFRRGSATVRLEEDVASPAPSEPHKLNATITDRPVSITTNIVASPSVSTAPSEISAAPSPTTRPQYPPSSSPGTPDGLKPIEAQLSQTQDRVGEAPSTQAPHDADNTLSTLLQWLDEVPANSVDSQMLLAWERILNKACEAQVSASRGMARSGLVSTAPTLTVSAPPAPVATQTKTSLTNPIDTVVRLLLHLWLDAGPSQASTKAIDRFICSGFRSDVIGFASAYQSWLEDIASRAQHFLRQHARESWGELQALTARNDSSVHYTSLGAEFSYRSFVAQCRQRIERQQRKHFRGSQSRRPQRAATPPSASGLLNSARAWNCGVRDISIATAGTAQQSLSLLTLVQFWKHLSCLRLDFSSGSYSGAAQLSVASVFNSLVTDGSFTKLTLDGQYRWFNCLPSGESTVGTTLVGYVVGDYVGLATSAGTIHLTTYLWPSGELDDTATETAFAWHWTIDAAALVSGGSSIRMRVVVESAPVGSTPHAMETMTMAEKLRYVDQWQQTGELQLAFRNEC